MTRRERAGRTRRPAPAQPDDERDSTVAAIDTISDPLAEAVAFWRTAEVVASTQVRGPGMRLNSHLGEFEVARPHARRVDRGARTFQLWEEEPRRRAGRDRPVFGGES